MRTANVLAAIAALLWFGVALVGCGLIGGVVDQHVMGYPNAQQIESLIVRPFLVVVVIVSLAWLCNGLRRWAGFLGTVAALALIALLPFLALSSGGV